MKHLRLFEGYENIDMTGLIRAWLSAIGVEESYFTINPDWSISTDCSIEIPNGYITKIPIKFKEISIEDSYFHCSYNNLKTLENFPEIFTGGDDCGEICYDNNPCWDDENQLKWLPVASMANGIVYNKKVDDFVPELGGNYRFQLKQSTMDSYWDEQIKKEPTYFLKLKVNPQLVWTQQSNNISEKLYKKHMNLVRGNKSGLLGFNK